MELLLYISLFSSGGVDFNTTNQTATFSSGITTSNISISVFNDTIVEGDEMFDLTLSVPELFNGRISTGSRNVAVGNITDNSSESFVLARIYNNPKKLTKQSQVLLIMVVLDTDVGYFFPTSIPNYIITLVRM